MKRASKDNRMEQRIFQVTGMHCDGCAERIQTLVGRLDGIRQAQASYPSGEVRVAFEPSRIAESTIRERIEQAGFQIGS
jgi:copper chaperone